MHTAIGPGRVSPSRAHCDRIWRMSCSAAHCDRPLADAIGPWRMGSGGATEDGWRGGGGKKKVKKQRAVKKLSDVHVADKELDVPHTATKKSPNFKVGNPPVQDG